MNLKLTLTQNPNIDCTLQTLILLLVMFGATFLFDRIRFFSIEFWLRKAESIIMNVIPKTGIFHFIPVK